jgi:phenylpyruvate tautomerase PptA (4-oxalocrotonate tautomerase family)
MPTLIIKTNANLSQDTAASLPEAASKAVAELLGKPETYVMTLFDRVVGMTMSGTDDPACLVEIRSVGKLTGDQTRALSQALGPLLAERLGIEPNRIYLNFNEYPGSMWGFNGSTFG